MNSSEKPAIPTKALIIIFTAIAALCAAAMLLINSAPRDGSIAVVTLDGKEIYRIDLDPVSESYTLPAGGCTILVEHGEISVCESDCPDKLCVHSGKLRSAAGSVVCLPNRVVVRILPEESEKAPDAVVR